MCKKLFIFFITFAYVEGSEFRSVSEGLHRSRRQLLWPNSTLLQFNVGVGTPTLAKNINMNYAFQANFQLPWNRTQIPTDVLVANNGLDGPTRKKRDVYQNDAKLMHFYKYVEDVLNGEITRYLSEKLLRFGATYDVFFVGFHYDGKSCVLQALCEVGAEPLHSDDEEDLLHELATFVLDPTHDADENMNVNDEPFPYIEAYRNGQNSKNCTEIYHKCKMSLVDVFTQLHHDDS